MTGRFNEYLKLPPYREVLEGIHASIVVSDGLIKLSGPERAGKTALCRQLQGELREAGFAVLSFHRPPASSDRLQALIRRRLRLPAGASLSHSLSGHLDGNDAGKLILIIDDAQACSDETLLALRLMLNIQGPTHGLVQVLLCGSPALDRRLAAPEQRSLVQRLCQSFRLAPMDRHQAAAFLEAWLGRCGAPGTRLTPGGARVLHRLTRGYPGAVLALGGRLAGDGDALPETLNGRLLKRRGASRGTRKTWPWLLVAGLLGVTLAASLLF